MPASRKSGARGSGRSPGFPLAEVVYQALRHELTSGAYRPGDRLREDEVAQRLHVSRTPVREAFGRLAAKGLVVPSGGRGPVVRTLEAAEVVELYAMREILEGGAARLASQHASPLRSMRSTTSTRSIVPTPAIPRRSPPRSHDSHRNLRSGQEPVFGHALQELQDAIALLGGTTFSVPGRPREAAAEHRAIIDAIARRDPDAAEQAARAHIREALRARLKMPRQQHNFADLRLPAGSA